MASIAIIATFLVFGDATWYWRTLGNEKKRIILIVVFNAESAIRQVISEAVQKNSRESQTNMADCVITGPWYQKPQIRRRHDIFRTTVFIK